RQEGGPVLEQALLQAVLELTAPAAPQPVRPAGFRQGLSGLFGAGRVPAAGAGPGTRGEPEAQAQGSSVSRAGGGAGSATSGVVVEDEWLSQWARSRNWADEFAVAQFREASGLVGEALGLRPALGGGEAESVYRERVRRVVAAVAEAGAQAQTDDKGKGPELSGVPGHDASAGSALRGVFAELDAYQRVVAGDAGEPSQQQEEAVELAAGRVAGAMGAAVAFVPGLHDRDLYGIYRYLAARDTAGDTAVHIPGEPSPQGTETAAAVAGQLSPARSAPTPAATRPAASGQRLPARDAGRTAGETPSGRPREPWRHVLGTPLPTVVVRHRAVFDIVTITMPDHQDTPGRAAGSPEAVDLAGTTGAMRIRDHFGEEPSHITLTNSDVILRIPGTDDMMTWLPIAQKIANHIPHRVKVPHQNGVIDLCPPNEADHN
ncbi:hypothetical protein ABZT06_50340, partial [Streptomyces sp. NPDC005483]|uniref:hypothetical protein n=1 Tax=Streptomyces sp. NPDC005483 TaxID=3154882 RepID=UPI0033A2A31C